MGWTAVCAGGRRPAREIAAREPSARSRRSRSPARPCRRPPAPRPGSAGHAGLAVPSMREPAARSRRSRSPARPCRRPPAPSTPVGLFIAVHIPSRPRRPRAPPPSSTARPLLSRSSRVALHTGGAWCAGGVIGVVLKPGYALPPPTGTAMGTSRRLYACVGFQSGLLGGAALGAGWRRVVGVSRL